MTMKKKLILLLLSIVTISQYTMAQDEPEDEPKQGFDKSKLFFGGNFGLSFGSYSTLINVSPQIGYRFSRYFAAGGGPNFIYYSQKYIDFAGNDIYRENMGYAGLNVFGRFYPIDQVFLQLQPEANYNWGKQKFYDGNTPDYKLDGKLVPSMLAGAGGAVPAGAGAFIVMVQYDLLQQPRSPYGNRAFFSFGYNMGF
jgi:hypothetical protein